MTHITQSRAVELARKYSVGGLEFDDTGLNAFAEAVAAEVLSQQGEAVAYCNSADIEKLKADKWACVEVSAYKVDGSENIPLFTLPPQPVNQMLVEALKINLALLERIEPFKGQEDLLTETLAMNREAIAAAESAQGENN